MPRRKTSADYHALAKDRGFRWLGPKVPNARTATDWECEQGHRWQATYDNIQRGKGCPICAIQTRAEKRRTKPADYRALAKNRGFRWLGPEVPSVRIKTSWECEQGHQWQATFDNIRRNRGCPVCANKVPLKPADYHALAEKRGFRWLGPEAANSRIKTGWKCEQGHQWQATYSHIQGGTGCPFCYGKVPLTPADYHALAKERGFHWLGSEVPNARTETRWECEQGHQWQATYNKIQQGRGCPVCAIETRAEKRRTKPADYYTLAKERGFRWLGPEVPSVLNRTLWECEQGHQWQATYGNIYHQGTGCPFCLDMVHGAQVSRVQRELCEMLGGELNHPFGPYRIDVALNIDGVAIAVEYDSWYWHGHKQDYDAQRDEELLAAGWRVLRIKSRGLLPSHEQLDAAVACLLAGKNQIEIVLNDWGEGRTRFAFD